MFLKGLNPRTTEGGLKGEGRGVGVGGWREHQFELPPLRLFKNCIFYRKTETLDFCDF